eukprot:30900-Pelagococcus_subviridis.AAC.1
MIRRPPVPSYQTLLYIVERVRVPADVDLHVVEERIPRGVGARDAEPREREDDHEVVDVDEKREFFILVRHPRQVHRPQRAGFVTKRVVPPRLRVQRSVRLLPRAVRGHDVVRDVSGGGVEMRGAEERKGFAQVPNQRARVGGVRGPVGRARGRAAAAAAAAVPARLPRDHRVQYVRLEVRAEAVEPRVVVVVVVVVARFAVAVAAAVDARDQAGAKERVRDVPRDAPPPILVPAHDVAHAIAARDALEKSPALETPLVRSQPSRARLPRERPRGVSRREQMPRLCDRHDDARARRLRLLLLL